jgi:hypothetical protein
MLTVKIKEKFAFLFMGLMYHIFENETKFFGAEI